MKEIILATNNQGKIAELTAILAPIICISQKDLGIESVEETGKSFVENALIKARHASAITNKPALADDSGLVVASLGGMPGIYSARYAGENASDGENINYLLEQLGTETAREAYFYCAIVVVNHTEDPTPLVAFGSWSGVIAPSPSGMDGFGYDPIFYIPSEQCTAAQLPATIKNSISHRAKALKQLQQLLIGNS